MRAACGCSRPGIRSASARRGRRWAAGVAAAPRALARPVVAAAGRAGRRRRSRPCASCSGRFELLFAPLSVAEIVAISALAGVGEEILFRGAVQASFGWPIATVAFGACHLGLSRRGWVLAARAAMAGGVLAGLAIATGGLVAPIVAHAGYDFAALLWIRRQVRARG